MTNFAHFYKSYRLPFKLRLIYRFYMISRFAHLYYRDIIYSRSLKFGPFCGCCQNGRQQRFTFLLSLRRLRGCRVPLQHFTQNLQGVAKTTDTPKTSRLPNCEPFVSNYPNKHSPQIPPNYQKIPTDIHSKICKHSPQIPPNYHKIPTDIHSKMCVNHSL